jgi:DNA cross-link repair 1A protein
MVDGFNFTNAGCSTYFLTHCHSDHTTGLTRSFSAGTIWCSEVRYACFNTVQPGGLLRAVKHSAAGTAAAGHSSCCPLPPRPPPHTPPHCLLLLPHSSARLLAAEWGLRAPTVKVLPLGQPRVMDGVTVTALDANHCPGSLMLLFEVPHKQRRGGVTRILHTGDCRCECGHQGGAQLPLSWAAGWHHGAAELCQVPGTVGVSPPPLTPVCCLLLALQVARGPGPAPGWQVAGGDPDAGHNL